MKDKTLDSTINVRVTVDLKDDILKYVGHWRMSEYVRELIESDIEARKARSAKIRKGIRIAPVEG